MNVTVRPLENDERPEWLRMRKALFPDCDDAMQAFEMDRHLAKGDNTAVLMAESDKAVVGFVELSIHERVEGSTEDRVGYLQGWYVEPPWRGQGVGRQLVSAAENWTRARGLRVIASDAEIENERSIAAHKALGFQETFRVVQFLKRLD